MSSLTLCGGRGHSRGVGGGGRGGIWGNDQIVTGLSSTRGCPGGVRMLSKGCPGNIQVVYRVVSRGCPDGIHGGVQVVSRGYPGSVHVVSRGCPSSIQEVSSPGSIRENPGGIQGEDV